MLERYQHDIVPYEYLSFTVEIMLNADLIKRYTE